jgi:hypothetical protein
MSFLENEIKKRNIPEVLAKKDGRRVEKKEEFEEMREEIKALLSEHIYGEIPQKPSEMSAEILVENERYMGGKTVFRRINISLTVYGERFSFPMVSVIPKSEKKLPAFLYINFDSEFPGERAHLPIEEITDGGFAVFTFGYNDVTSDNGDFDNGVAKIFREKMNAKSAPGKIAMWAWAAGCVMDYIQTVDIIDKQNIAVIGHSRLGKTALLTGAFDERFKYVISNDSGCSGAAITRGKVGENIADITRVFPYWFTDKYKDYAGEGIDSFPIEQNFLTSLVVPRHLIIGSAELDEWADPKSEFLNAFMTNEVYKLYGMQGLICEDKYPVPKTVLDEGESSYHIRHSGHFLSREDWAVYMNYIHKKM